MGSEWRKTTLGDVAVFENRRRVPLSARERATRRGDYPYWGANGPFDEVDDFLFDGPHVLVAEDGNTVVRPDGRPTVHWADGQYWVNNHAHVLSARPNVDLSWLYYTLTTANVRGLVSGSAQPKLSMGSLKRLGLPLPPLREQHAISTTLRALDDKVKSNRQLSDVGAATLNALFQHLASCARYRVHLRQLASEVKVRVQPATTPTEQFEHFSIPAFDARLGPEVCKGNAMASAKTVLPCSPVILVSKLNPAKKRVWWPERLGIGFAVCSPEFVALTPHQPEDAAWVYGCVAFDKAFSDQILAAVTGTTGSRQRVKPSDVLAAEIPVVDSKHREHWDSLGTALLGRQVQLLRESRTLTAIRDALLPKLVSGQIRVPLSNDPEEQVGAAIEGLA
jgi:type I restriction enzyme S subunit